jgi:hypothetical protein
MYSEGQKAKPGQRSIDKVQKTEKKSRPVGRGAGCLCWVLLKKHKMQGIKTKTQVQTKYTRKQQKQVPVGAHTGSGAHPASYTMGTGSPSRG